MKLFIIAAAILATVSAQYKPEEIVYVPIPYSFNYLSETEDGGSSGRQESGDGAGTVRGSYTVNNLEGHSRVVEYEAGPEGFKAFIRTNEPGTDNSSPAGVVVESSAPEAKATSYSNSESPRPAIPVQSQGTGGQRQNIRYVPRPSNDPRARRN